MNQNDRFLKACNLEPVDSTPVWLMRQARRYMAAYRRLRERYSLLAMFKTPEIAAEVTLQPIAAFGLDAAIIFADILLPLEGMGGILPPTPEDSVRSLVDFVHAYTHHN